MNTTNALELQPADTPSSTDVRRSIQDLRGFIVRFVTPFSDLDKHLITALELLLKLEDINAKIESAEIRYAKSTDRIVNLNNQLSDLDKRKVALEAQITDLQYKVQTVNKEFIEQPIRLEQEHRKSVRVLEDAHNKRKGELEVEIQLLEKQRNTLKTELKNDLKTVEELSHR